MSTTKKQIAFYAESDVAKFIENVPRQLRTYWINSALRSVIQFKSRADVKPIWDEFGEIISAIPKNEMKSLPSDAAEQHDHYLYGNAKGKK